ncbi:MAG TPA: hypothetical protein VFL36_10455 [Myxococcales bacterium]|nr:hypothetical protein [Myxococcales bacterium]
MTESSALRIRSEFAITVHAPPEAAFALFGGYGERAWAGKDWDPQFLRPSPPEDRAGAVFLMPLAGRERLWLTTRFDRARGHVRHVYLLEDSSVCVIDVRLVAKAPEETRVSVAYERTSLRPEADDDVRRLAAADAEQGPEWEAAIAAALSTARAAKPA